MIPKSGNQLSEKITLQRNFSTTIRFNLIGSWSSRARKRRRPLAAQEKAKRTPVATSVAMAGPASIHAGTTAGRADVAIKRPGESMWRQEIRDSQSNDCVRANEFIRIGLAASNSFPGVRTRYPRSIFDPRQAMLNKHRKQHDDSV